MAHLKLLLMSLILCVSLNAQTNIYRDTIPVYESGNRLLSPWAGGINFSSFSQMDLDADGKKDLVSYDKICSGGGKLKTYLNIGTNGIAKYKHAPNYQDNFPPVLAWALLFDYNQDGKEDFFTCTMGGGIKVFKNISSGSTLHFAVASSLLKSDYNPSGTPNLSTIYGSSVGFPGFADIDGDGDLDILTYSIFGIKMEYHKNMSKELYGHADSLVFDMVDDCWGDMQENSCNLYLDQCPFMKMYNEVVNGNVQKILHAGSCIMCFDRDGDGDQELILGDVSCSDVFFVENTGSATNNHIGDSTKLYPNYPNKGSTTIIKMNSFPCTYYLDVDNDGFKDLIASPNSIAGAENYQSVWYYKNTSSTPTVNFSIHQKNFLQEDMIELGEGAYPVLFDADEDGKKDLIVGNLGYYTGNTNKSKLAYYRNIGTISAPSFSLITRDYQSLSVYNIYSIAPTFGDLDNDGDKDLIIGDNNGQLHFFENTAGVGNPAVFGTHISYYKSIDVGNYAYPQLYDVDKNGILDLVVGSQNGKITYLRNTGTSTFPSFSLQSSFFGNIDVRQQTYITGFSTPYMYSESGITKLLVGSEIGNIYLYDNIDGNLSGSFNRVDTNLYKINEGTRCAPFFEDITNDGKRDLFLGNHAGGLAFFNSTNINSVGIDEKGNMQDINVFPNPANDKITISINNNTYEETKIRIIDILGKEVFTTVTFNKVIQIDISGLSKGVYLVRLDSKGENKVNSSIKKIVIQ